MFVTTAISGWRWWNVRSYSSASTTRNSPAPLFAFVPRLRSDAADEDRRIESRLFEDRGDHRRGRGLAVRAGDADGALLVDDRAEHLGALHDRGCRCARAASSSALLAFDRGGDDDEIDARRGARDRGRWRRRRRGWRRSSVAAERFEVASGDGDSRLRQDLGDATHSDSADADEMNGPNLIKIHPELIS